MAKIFLTAAYEKRLCEIEDFIFESTGALEAVGRFLDEHDRILAFLANNPETPGAHPEASDRSWVFGDGRYRLFFQSVIDPEYGFKVYLTHIIDNRQLNQGVYSGNTMPTFDED